GCPARRTRTGTRRSPAPPRSPVLLVDRQARLLFEPAEARLEPIPVATVLREEGVALPPVDAHLAGLVGRGDEEPQPDRQELDVEQVDLNVAGDHDSLVEDALEIGRASCRERVKVT